MSLLPIGKQRCKRRKATGITTLVALVLTTTLSLLGTGTASAVTGPATTKPAAAKTAHERAHHAAKKTARKPEAKKTPKADRKAQHAAAAREIGRSDLPDTCSGAIDPDTVYSCSTWPADGASLTFTLTRPTDLVFIQIVSTDDFPVYPTLTAPDGTQVDCDTPDGEYGALRCPTGAVGTYTLTAGDYSGGGAGFSVAYTPLLSDTACTAVTATDSALGAPVDLPGTLAAGSAGVCYTLPMAAGDMLRAHLSKWQVTGTVYDATGAQVCSTSTKGSPDIDCRLTGSAPFRVLADQASAESEDFTLTLARLSTPSGCPVVEPQAYGTVPGADSTARCRLLRASDAGPYLFGPVGSGAQGSLYAADGTPMCTPTLVKPCALAAGDYTWALDGSDTDAGAFGVWFHAMDRTDGCTAAHDNDFASGAATGEFDGPGEQLCLALPTTTGNGLYLVDQPPQVEGVEPDVTVFDATGTQQCDDDYAFSVCKLTGTAPFHAVLAGPDTGTYRLTVQRTGDISGCTAWPQSAFGGSWGVQASLTADDQAVCLGIAGDQHSTAEMFDYTNTTNQANASVQVYDSAGNQVCNLSVNSTTTCVFTPGADYAAVLMGTGHTDTYDLVRRDISSTATCAAPSSLTVGGPSTGFTLDSALDSTCLRVTAAATDNLWLSVRTPTAEQDSGAVLGVADATGKVVCHQYGVSCRVTGSTSYIVYVLASGYAGTPITAHVDTWRIGTADGWAPQCTANTVSPDGFPLREGTLSETSTAYCAVIDMKPSQRFEVYGTYSGPHTGTPWVSLLSTTRFAGTSVDYAYQCYDDNVNDFSFSCLTTSSAPTGQYVLLVTPADAQTPVDYAMQGVCKQGCSSSPQPAELTSVSPASGPAESANQVVLHGANLTLGTHVELASNGLEASPYQTSEPVSVSPDGTSLTVQLLTYGVAPGTYDIVLDGVGYTAGTPSQGYLPGAYTVTPPPAVARVRRA